MIDGNLIAYEYYKNQYVPKEVYTSGEKEETTLINKYGMGLKPLPVLILKDDIVNNEGMGLKQGFYNVLPDNYLDFLLIFQEGKLKAKVPVFEVIHKETINPEQKKPKKMSYSRYKKEQEKEYRKYLKGENPAEVEWQEVEIIPQEEKNAYILIYRSNNLELRSIIKL